MSDERLSPDEFLKAVHFADGHTVVFGSAADSEGKD